MTDTAEIKVKAQDGPQRRFLTSTADIAIYGGARGGGKSFALLMEPLRHIENPHFAAVIFRRTTVEVRNVGGLWSESEQLYPMLNADGSSHSLSWRFPSGARIRFAHMMLEKDKDNWQGAQIPMIGYDELTHFTEGQFFFMLGSNRSTCGVRPYIRATCNPDPDSFVAKLVEWWIDPETGYPIEARSGEIRWFVRNGDVIEWADTPGELKERFGSKMMPKSFTFIPASVEDNKILMDKDPGYYANLMAMSLVDRERFLHGNWKIKPAAGTVFRREWFEIVDAAPASSTLVRYWDRASLVPSPSSPDPDWTAGVKMSRSPAGQFFVEDVARFRAMPTQVESSILNTATQDTKRVLVGIEKDPGQAGNAEAGSQVRNLAGFNVKVVQATNSKVVRAGPASAQAGAGNIKIVRGKWNEEFLRELENFPDGNHDDQVDGFSGAFNLLAGTGKVLLA